MDLNPLMTTLPINMERTYIMVKPDGVQRGLVCIQPRLPVAHCWRVGW